MNATWRMVHFSSIQLNLRSLLFHVCDRSTHWVLYLYLDKQRLLPDIGRLAGHVAQQPTPFAGKYGSPRAFSRRIAVFHRFVRQLRASRTTTSTPTTMLRRRAGARMLLYFATAWAPSQNSRLSETGRTFQAGLQPAGASRASALSRRRDPTAALVQRRTGHLTVHLLNALRPQRPAGDDNYNSLIQRRCTPEQQHYSPAEAGLRQTACDLAQIRDPYLTAVSAAAAGRRALSGSGRPTRREAYQMDGG